jgi:crossover junction endodeoxyribonuclease RuvC
MQQLAEQLQKLIARFAPDRAGIEKLFFSSNVRTAMAVAEARGVVMLTLHAAGLAVEEFTPQQVKMSVTGYGKADKKQVEKIVCAILKLSPAPKPDDAVDALAVALTCQSRTIVSREK